MLYESAGLESSVNSLKEINDEGLFQLVLTLNSRNCKRYFVIRCLAELTKLQSHLLTQHPGIFATDTCLQNFAKMCRDFGSFLLANVQYVPYLG